jgi:hypothetical protein
VHDVATVCPDTAAAVDSNSTATATAALTMAPSRLMPPDCASFSCSFAPSYMLPLCPV